MKKVVIGIFAHPDDEAFLASGSFITWVHQGADLHLICATKGENGENPDSVADLGETRLDEWKNASKLMGARTQFQLNYPDGKLSNSLFHDIADAVLATIKDVMRLYSEPISLDVVTYENCGVTGHIDHITISFVTAYVYRHIQQVLPTSTNKTRLLYVCACEAVSPQSDTSFVFMPKGHNHAEIDLTIDVSDVLEQKKRVMRAHKSQRKDAEAIITKLGDNLAYEHFNFFKA